jgi:RNA polymerase sigma factor (sigma-70 family)
MTSIKRPSSNQRFSTLLEVFIRHHDFLRRFIARFLSQPEDIEDILQETYLRTYQAEQNKIIEQPKAFLFRTAKNIALTELTKKSRQITDYIEDLGSPSVIEDEVSLESEVETRQRLALYCEAVAALPEKCRRVYLLRKVHGLSHQQIAERMGLTISSTEKYLLRGVLACRTYVREREESTTPAASKTRQPRHGK